MVDKTSKKDQDKKSEQKKAEQKKADKEVKEKKAEKHNEKERLEESLTRIAGYDVPASRNIISGLTRIKGVSWSVSNAICIKLGIDKSKKISAFTKEEIVKIESFLKNPIMNDYLKNRRFDEDTGEIKHLFGTELDIRKDFDIRKMKKIRSYKGVRHIINQPVRGQRTRSHFRRTGKAMGVKRSKK